MFSSFVFFYFTDPVLRAPTIGCMLMCVAASLIGVIVFIRKRSLLGEALSHATYPGVVLTTLLTARFTSTLEPLLPIIILVGAGITSLLGIWIMEIMERRMKVRYDSALCFILSSFFGIGITFASYIQFTHTSLYRQVQTYLYGQAATMTDLHIVIYSLLACLIITVIVLSYKEIQAVNFDRDFSKIVGIRTKLIDNVIFLLIILAIVIGIRSVGLILISGMLIAPAIAARQYTNTLSFMFLLAGTFGLFSGFLGMVFSVELSRIFTQVGATRSVSLATGPMIILVASSICILSLFFSPKKGLVLRYIRITFFRHECLLENILKSIWRLSCSGLAHISEIAKYQNISRLHLYILIYFLIKQGWLTKEKPCHYQLTQDGRQRAARIVRLHRLWEVYLVDYLGVGEEKVHPSAEEMEHIITPEIERTLTELMDDPKQDPHKQPIPPPQTILE